MMAAVETVGLTKRFGSFTAVDDFDLTLDSGKVLALLGPNGAGKTTLIRMLCGILPPTSGKARVLGFDISTQSDRLRERIGYMSQRFSLYDDLTVDENLDFYGRIYGLSGKDIGVRKGELYENLDFVSVRSDLVGNISGGVRQKVAFAAANLHKPKLLFLDEPTSGADPSVRQAFWDMVYLMADEGTTVIISTHYMNEAERADKIVMVLRGKPILDGTPAQLKERFEGKLFEMAVPDILDAYGAVLEAVHGRAAVEIHGRTLHIGVNEADLDVLGEICRKTGLQWSAIREIRPSLEDVFIQLAKEGTQDER